MLDAVLEDQVYTLDHLLASPLCIGITVRGNPLQHGATARAPCPQDHGRRGHAPHFVEGRIKELEDKLARAQVIDPKEIKTDKIVFGATVVLMDLESEEKRRYQIVGTDEADAKAGLISIKSPIARQLLNRKAGEEVTIRVPKGDLEYEILEVIYE